MREHKFRAWDKILNYYSRCSWAEISYSPQGECSLLNVGRYIVEQSTGRNDSKGTEIYGGSTVSFAIFDHNDHDTQYTGKVYWDEDDLAWNIKYNEKDEVLPLGDVMRQDDEFEVIGTIHDEEARP